MITKYQKTADLLFFDLFVLQVLKVLCGSFCFKAVSE